jgi:hypothetical protein
MDPQLATKGSSSPVPGIKEGERFVDLYDVMRTTCAAREFTGESLPDRPDPTGSAWRHRCGEVQLSGRSAGPLCS